MAACVCERERGGVAEAIHAPETTKTILTYTSFSKRLVFMTMTGISNSQIMRQKSPIVRSKGPCAAMYRSMLCGGKKRMDVNAGPPQRS